MTLGYASRCGIEIETIETHCFLFCAKRRSADGKTSGLRRARDFRESRGITVICGGLDRAFAVQGDGLEGGQPARGAAGRTAVQPHLAAACLDRCWPEIV